MSMGKSKARHPFSNAKPPPQTVSMRPRHRGEGKIDGRNGKTGFPLVRQVWRSHGPAAKTAPATLPARVRHRPRHPPAARERWRAYKTSGAAKPIVEYLAHQQRPANAPRARPKRTLPGGSPSVETTPNRRIASHP